MCTAFGVGLANKGRVYCSAHFYDVLIITVPLLNANAPNDHYELNFAVFVDRHVMEQIVCINEWESAQAARLGVADLPAWWPSMPSQHTFD